MGDDWSRKDCGCSFIEPQRLKADGMCVEFCVSGMAI
jgi:hypothetical protein